MLIELLCLNEFEKLTLDPKDLKDKGCYLWQNAGSTGCILSSFMTLKSSTPNPDAWTLIIMEEFEIGLFPNSMIRDDGQGLVLSSSQKHLIYCMKDALLQHYGPSQGQAHFCQLYVIFSRPHHIPDHPFALRLTFTHLCHLFQLSCIFHLPTIIPDLALNFSHLYTHFLSPH